jgi:iron complex outermembrane receptor protein
MPRVVTPSGAFRLGLVLLLLSASPTAAQEDPSEARTDGIEAIVVTITRRAESVQEVASSVSAFSEGQIEEFGIAQLADLVSLLPGVTAKGDRAEAITVRGISQSFLIGAQSPVARHVNGIFRYDNESYLGQFYDLQNVEAVRGPSGTVYGRNATAGAMNVIWKEPHAATELLGDVTVGNFDQLRVRGVANVPLLGEGDERLMARLVVQREVYDGWVDNRLQTRRDDPEHGDDTYYRLSLRSVPTEDVELSLRGWRHESDTGPFGVKTGLDSFRAGRFPDFDALTGGPVPFDPFNGFQDFLSGTVANGGGPLLAFGLVNQAVFGLATVEEGMQLVLLNGVPSLGIPPLVVSPEFFTPAPADPSAPHETLSLAGHRGRTGTEAWGIDGELEWLIHDVHVLGDIQLNLLGGWESLDTWIIGDFDGSSIPLLEQVNENSGKTRVAELRLGSAGDGAIQWIAGLFYFEREFVSDQSSFGFFGVAEGLFHLEESGWAPFLSVSWSPIEDLELFGGARWNRDTFQRAEFANEVPGVRAELTLDPVKERYRETTREVGLRWSFHEDHMVYVKFAKGYKAGFLETDLNGAFGPPGATNVLAPEILDAWEAGLKTSWLDATLQVNVAAYFYGYDDLQVPLPIGFDVVTRNAAAAEVKGVDLELAYQPNPDWHTRLAVSWMDATFDSFCSADPFQFTPADDPGCTRAPGAPPPNGLDGALDLSGNHLEDTPEWQVSLVTSYTVPLGDWGTLTSVLSFEYVDDYFARPFNVELVDRIDSYTRTGVRFIWRSPDERYTVEVFGTHLEDETIYGRRIALPEFIGNPVQTGRFAPRRYGVRVGFRWGGE